MPSVAQTAMPASALRTLCAPSSGTSKVPNSVPCLCTLNRVPPGPTDSSLARHVGSPSMPKVSTGLAAWAASAAARGLSDPSSSMPLRGTSTASRLKASSTAATSG